MAHFITFLALTAIFSSAHSANPPIESVPDFVLLEVEEPELKSLTEILGRKADALDFGLGFLKGLYRDTDDPKCVEYLGEMRDHLRKALVLLEIENRPDRGKVELVYELTLLQLKFSQLVERCELKDRVTLFWHKFSHMSIEHTVSSYKKNSSDLNLYLLSLLFTCHIDSDLCGRNLSNILNSLTDFQLECNDVIDIGIDLDEMVKGIIQGLKKPMSQEACMNAMNTLHTDADTVVIDLYDIIELKDIEHIIQLLKDYQTMVEHMKATAEVCPFDDLGEIMEQIPTWEGMKDLVINMFINYDVLMKDYKNLLVCSEDWEVCGFTIGEVFRVVFKWGI